MPNAAGRSAAVCEMTLRREEAFGDGVGQCLLFLEGFVIYKKNGSFSSHHACKSLWPIHLHYIVPSCSDLFLIECRLLPHNRADDTSKSRMSKFFLHPLRSRVIIYINS